MYSDEPALQIAFFISAVIQLMMLRIYNENNTVYLKQR